MRRMHLVRLMVLAALALPLMLVVPAGAASATTSCAVTKLAPVLYTAIDGHTETLTPWQGPKVAVLVEPG